MNSCKKCGRYLYLSNEVELCTKCQTNGSGYTKFEKDAEESTILNSVSIQEGNVEEAIKAIELVGFSHNLYELGPDYIPSNGFFLVDTEAWRLIKKFILKNKVV